MRVNSENVKEEIIKIQKQLPEFKGKLPEKENHHITLKFLGEISENQN
jgi:2'-5' RNA ligase